MYNKMSRVAIIGVAALVICCFSLSAGMTMMGGEETGGTTGPAGGVTNCDVAKTDWINSKMQNDGWSRGQGEAAQKCKVPANLQSRIKECDVAKTDWIKSKMQNDGLSQDQGEAAQDCFIPTNLQARIIYCDVAKTDWINSKMQNNGWSQAQGEAAQDCFVPTNLQARIGN
jgi:hypothetical protein